MQAYEAYVENGNVYPIGEIMNTSKRMKAIITILDEVETEIKKPVRPPFKYGCAGEVWMSDDFDAPMEEFKEYME